MEFNLLLSKRKNKKAIVPIMVFITVGVVILILYGLLYLPFFKLQKEMVNYILVLVLWVTIQALIIFAVIKLGTYGYSYFMKFKNNINKWAFDIKKLMITHY